MNMNKINKLRYYIYTQFYLKRKLKKIGKKTIVFAPLQINYPSSIELGNDVFVCEGAWLMGSAKHGASRTLCVGDGTIIGHFCHIVANHNVYIGQDVLMADRVFISDCKHKYEDVDIPVIKQEIQNLNKVYIGDGSHIGENVCIQGASIGKHCIIGANSVVTKDIPDYSVAAGCPAVVKKSYDFTQKKWIKV